MAVHLTTLVTLAFCITGSMAITWNHGLHVRFGLKDAYYKIALTVTDILEENWVKMAHDDELNADLYSLPDDPRVSVLFDSYGNIAGMRVCYIKADVDSKAKEKGVPFTYTYDDKPLFQSGIYYDTDVWYSSILFISPEKLKAGGREETNGLVGEDMYMRPAGTWIKIPKDECQVESVGFTKQSCFVGMGMHYFWNLSPETKCEDFVGAFVLYESGELIGLGFNPFAYFTSKDRVWFEDVPSDVGLKIAPNGPACLPEFIDKLGNLGFHIFFKKYPRLTFCTWPWQKSDQCKK